MAKADLDVIADQLPKVKSAVPSDKARIDKLRNARRSEMREIVASTRQMGASTTITTTTIGVSTVPAVKPGAHSSVGGAESEDTGLEAANR